MSNDKLTDIVPVSSGHVVTRAELVRTHLSHLLCVGITVITDISLTSVTSQSQSSSTSSLSSESNHSSAAMKQPVNSSVVRCE